MTVDIGNGAIAYQPAELAKRLNVSKTTLQNWRNNEEGPMYIKIGQVILYPADEVERWIREKAGK